jgi:hypothetical protein
MSTEREPLAQEPKLTVRVRPAKLVLPADPADEELARDWTLSEADKGGGEALSRRHQSPAICAPALHAAQLRSLPRRLRFGTSAYPHPP